MGGSGSPLLQVFTYLIISFTLQAPLGPKSRLGLTVTTSAQARAGHCQQVGVTWSPSRERMDDGGTKQARHWEYRSAACQCPSEDKRARQHLTLADEESARERFL